MNNLCDKLKVSGRGDIVVVGPAGNLRQVCSIVFQRVYSAFVVGFVGDFLDEIRVDHIAFLIDDQDRSGEQTGKRAVDHGQAVVLPEFRRAESRSGDYSVDAFGRTETRHRERQIHRHAYDHSVVELGGLTVEPPHRCGADRGVEAREDIEHDAFAGETLSGDFVEIFADESERGRLLASDGHIAACLHCCAFEENCFHIYDFVLFDVFIVLLTMLSFV